MKINLSKFLGLPFLAVTLGSTAIHAQTVTTSPVGFVRYNALANSDIFVTPPFERPAFWTGTIASVSGNVVTLNNASLTANQLVYAAGTQPNTYYLKIGNHSTTNPKEGNYYTITANGTNTVTLDLAGDNISAIASGTKAKIIPYWTLNTLYPNGQGVVASANPLVLATEVLIPNQVGNGVNLSASATYFYLSSASQWRKVGSADNQNDTILNPDSYFVVRNKGAASQFAIAGNVDTGKSSLWLRTQNSGKQDNPIGLARPMPVKLNDLGLISSGAFAASPNALLITDELLVFDNTTPGINKSASATYFYTGGQWRKVGNPNDAGNDTVNLYEGVIIRKNQVANGPTVVGVNAPNYPTN
jgi:uncharacterized protein (TIGR02597 family)